MTIQEGSSLPEATLHVMQEGKPTAMSVGDLFGEKGCFVCSTGALRLPAPMHIAWLRC